VNRYTARAEATRFVRFDSAATFSQHRAMTSETEIQSSRPRAASVNQLGAGSDFLSALFGILAGVLFLVQNTWSSQQVVIEVTSFGAKPDSGQDAALAVKAALDQVASLNGKPAVLRFPKGRYDFWATNAPKVHYAITGVHQQWDFIAGLHLNGLKHLTVEGNGAELLFHSRMTPIIVNQCEDVEIRHLSIDHTRPTVSEFTLQSVGDTSMDVNLYFCTGLGIVAQLSEDLTFRRVKIEPRQGSGRTCASFADGLHCCNCSGQVLIEDCRIVGTQDDPVNVYGDDLVIKSRAKPNELVLSYPSWELCG
jgi:hypothetical protein